MKNLFIDTSLSNLTIGIVDNNKLINTKNIKLDNELSIYAVYYIDQLFKESNLDIKDIDQIIVTNGPGSYTGVRVGVTIAKTIAWALNKKIIPISSLKALSLSVNNYDYIICLLDARRDCYFAAIYDQNNNDIIKEQYLDKNKLLNYINNLQGDFILVSDKDFNINELNVKQIDLDILKIVNYFSSYEGLNPHEVNPNYLKDTEAEENLK
jgi:tRNA threonylcarbamoyladenosine biosynthesis protein TsaB